MAVDPLHNPVTATLEFFQRSNIAQVEEGTELAPKFDAAGLITCVTTAADGGELLMVGVMNAEALALTIQTGEAHYWSGSRQVLWHKGPAQPDAASC